VLGGGTDRRLHCVDATDGDSIWATTLGTTWDFGTGSREYWMESSAAVVGDSVVFVGSRDGNVYCLDTSDGSVKWNATLTTGGYIVSSPAYWDGRIYIGATGTAFGSSDSSCVYCLDADEGGIHWRHTYQRGSQGGTMSSPTIDGPNQYVYIGINKNVGTPPEHNGGAIACYSLVYDGDTQTSPQGIPVNPEWMTNVECDVRGTPVLLDDLVYASTGKGLWIVEADDGEVVDSCVKPGGNEELWSSFTASCHFTVAEQETILYVGNGGFGDGDGFYALNTSLTTLWNMDTDCEVWGSAAICTGHVVVADNNGTVYCFVDDPNGDRVVKSRDVASGPIGGRRKCPAARAGEQLFLEALQGATSWPQPFVDEVTLCFDLPGLDHASVDLIVVDGAGRVVRTLLASAPCGGHQVVRWDGCTDRGGLSPSGVYFYRLAAGGVEVSRTMTLLR
jgi:outer membrane protein assembly factor BamB